MGLDRIRYAVRSPAAVIKQIYGPQVTIRGRRGVGGGCINDTAVLDLSNGTELFLKTNRLEFAGLFEEEARGLLALARSEGPRVPQPLGLFFDDQSQYLLMEFIPEGRRTADFWFRFGSELAALHRSNRHDRCGFEKDNHIGATPQRNRWESSWFDFFGEHRLRYQIELARRNRHADEKMEQQVDRLVRRLPELLPDLDQSSPSLLHGDLWGGNYIVAGAGEPVLIDPAVYYGHREVDLAMTELFGGFSPAFYRAYQETWPLEPGYPERRDLYNLYHLLNHLNLFGGGYLSSCTAILRRFS